ncbi:unnamed protein product [Angiostrongylus costaricensis]|uniref:Sortilin_C domain-containing protein n=1 Tax=Angiostrongylus costaricensis TaxID=334426 RepID=A0A0R3PMS7_ANGCS|nr:unnamed protein product [Angiostrongylus costaricensis]
MCQGAYLLSENCFPNFINSVLCDKREIGCIFDFSDRPHGTCREEPLTLPVLRNHGSSECEDWIPYEIQVQFTGAQPSNSMINKITNYVPQPFFR